MKIQSTYLLSLLKISVLLFLVLALYFKSLHAPFVFDDFTFFSSFDASAKYGFSSVKFGLRWLPNATLGWTVSWLGLNVLWLRLGNVLLHAVNAITLFYLLRTLFRASLGNDKSSVQDPHSLSWFAFFGALVFALHPVAAYGVTYLIQRSILMATLFVMLMLLTYLQGLLRGSWYWMLAAVLFYLAAVYSKEHSVAAPGVALAMTFLVRKPSLALFKQISRYYIILAILAMTVLYAISKMGILATAYEPHSLEILKLSAQRQGVTELPNPYLLSILTQSFLFFKYLMLWLLPNPAWMSVDMREPLAVSYLSWPHTLGLVGFLVYPCVAVWLLLKQGKMGLLGFALLFPWILFLTELSTVRAQEPFVLYRSYLWMPGLFVALPAIFANIAPRRAFIILGIFAVTLIPLSLNRLNTFSSALLLWDDAEKLVQDKHNMPGVERIYINRGNKQFQLKHYNEAIADLTQSIATFPGDELVFGTRAKAYYFINKYPEALADFNQAIALKADSRRLYYDRALTYLALGDKDAAQVDLKKSCNLGGVCP